MAISQESLTPTDSTTFDSDDDSSSFDSSLASSMEAQPTHPFFPERRVCAKKKSKPHEETSEESDGSIESSPSNGFFITRKQQPVNYCTFDLSTSSYATTTHKRKERDLDNYATAAKNKHVHFDTTTESCLENKHVEEEVSTEPVLFDFVNGFERTSTDGSSSSLSGKDTVSKTFLAPNLVNFKSCRFECDEESRMGILTELKLYNDPWVIKKSLTRSDIGHLCRLTNLDYVQILPVLGSDRAEKIHSEEGLQVTILDLDTSSEHELIFKKGLKHGSYTFMVGWKEQFVRRKGLKIGDEIGLFWDRYSSRFYFRVLVRAPAQLEH